MNKSDKYYLKQGKLELSMLEDEEDELELRNSIQRPSKKDLFVDLEFPYSKRLKDNSLKTLRAKEPKLKVTKDISNTLHMMGQFLTKSDEGEIDPVKVVPPRRSINTAKAQKLEQIASTLKIQEVELPPRVIEKEEVVEKVSELSSREETPFESLSGERLKEKISVGIPNQEQLSEDALEARSVLKDEINTEINELLAEEKELEAYSQTSRQEEQELQINKSAQIQEMVQEEIEQEEIEQKEIEQKEIEQKEIEQEEIEQKEIEQKEIEQEEIEEKEIEQEEIEQEEIEQEEISAEEIIEDIKKETIEDVLDKNESKLSAIERKMEQVYPNEGNLVDLEKKNTIEEEIVKENTKELKQKDIDQIIKGFFGKSICQYPFAKELKKHIDKQISLIENYE